MAAATRHSQSPPASPGASASLESFISFHRKQCSAGVAAANRCVQPFNHGQGDSTADRQEWPVPIVWSSNSNIVASGLLPDYSPGMSALQQIQRLPLHDKLLVMEALWDDLSRNTQEVEVPQWHKDVLDERERLLNAGEARFIDWEVARQEIEAAIA